MHFKNLTIIYRVNIIRLKIIMLSDPYFGLALSASVIIFFVLGPASNLYRPEKRNI